MNIEYYDTYNFEFSDDDSYSHMNLMSLGRVSKGGGAFGACAPPPLSLMPNEKICED